MASSTENFYPMTLKAAVYELSVYDDYIDGNHIDDEDKDNTDDDDDFVLSGFHC